MSRPAPRRSRPGPPPFLRWLALHMAIGVAAGWTALAAILARDVGDLRTLIAGSPSGAVALVMLAVFFAITFGGAGMGFAIMMQPREKTDGED